MTHTPLTPEQASHIAREMMPKVVPILAVRKKKGPYGIKAILIDGENPSKGAFIGMTIGQSSANDSWPVDPQIAGLFKQAYQDVLGQELNGTRVEEHVKWVSPERFTTIERSK